MESATAHCVSRNAQPCKSQMHNSLEGILQTFCFQLLSFAKMHPSLHSEHACKHCECCQTDDVRMTSLTRVPARQSSIKTQHDMSGGNVGKQSVGTWIE